MEQLLELGGTTWDWVKGSLALLGFAGLTIGTITAAAFGIFRWFGEKWINQKFEKQLEAYKTEQSRELEKLRHKINGVFDRTIRLHSKEFDVLPDLWAKLVEAHRWACSYTSPFQSYANVERMDSEELAELLKAMNFSRVQNRDIARSSTRQKTFMEVKNICQYSEAMDKLIAFNDTFKKSGIFVKPEIKADMDAMIEIINRAVSEKKSNQDYQQTRQRDAAYEKLDSDGKALFNKIEAAIADRLWDSTTTEL